MKVVKGIWHLFRESVIGWSRNDAMLHAAAIAYWVVLSVAPLLMLTIAIASQVFSQAFVEYTIVDSVANGLGPEVAYILLGLIQSTRDFSSSLLATSIGIVFVIYSASNVFMQLQTSLDAMWGMQQLTDTIGESLIATAKSRLVAAASVLTVGFLLLGSLLLNALWTAIPEQYVEPILANLGRYRTILDIWTSPLVYWVLFGLIFKALPRAGIRWRDVWPGALLTAVLFWLGGYVIGLYLGYTFLTSIYGATGSLIALLLWAYYSAWIILFGAKFTQVYTDTYGVPIVPYKSMVFRDETPRNLADSDL